MYLIVCLDDMDGMMFNHRRQSRDSALRADMLSMTEGAKLYMNGYSAGQFDLKDGITVSEAPLDEAGAGDWCFIEDLSPTPFAGKIEKLVIYRWNRRYPADLRFGISLDGWRLMETAEFLGTSHEKISKEVYVR
ncbi:MAG: ribonuclease Z [Candidatus Heteroscillospira sp.]|jgi:hypothetical protein